MYVCTPYVCGTLESQKRASDLLGLEFQMIVSCLPCGCLKLNLDPLDEQPVPITIEPPLQLFNTYFIYYIWWKIVENHGNALLLQHRITWKTAQAEMSYAT